MKANHQQWNDKLCFILMICLTACGFFLCPESSYAQTDESSQRLCHADEELHVIHRDDTGKIVMYKCLKPLDCPPDSELVLVNGMYACKKETKIDFNSVSNERGNSTSINGNRDSSYQSDRTDNVHVERTTSNGMKSADYSRQSTTSTHSSSGSGSNSGARVNTSGMDAALQRAVVNGSVALIKHAVKEQAKPSHPNPVPPPSERFQPRNHSTFQRYQIRELSPEEMAAIQRRNEQAAQIQAIEDARKAQEIAVLNEAAERSGVVIEIGAGYGTFANILAHLGGGYVFNPYFSLFADVAYSGPFAPENEVRAAVTPKLTLHKNSFQFSLGAGLGMLWVDEWSMRDIYIMLRPVLEFDWYVTHYCFVGFGIASPIFFDTDPDHALYLRDSEYYGSTPQFEFDWGGALGEVYFHFGFKI